MALAEVPSRLFTAIFQTEDKGSKLVVPIAHGEKLGCTKRLGSWTFVVNIYIADIFHLMNGTKICNRAGDTTLYSCDREAKHVITKPEQNANHLTPWFPENHMKLIEDKCHVIIFGTSKEKVNMHVGEVQIEESDDEKVLGITLDKKLSFKNTPKSSVKKLIKSFMHLHTFQSTWNPRS